MQSNKHLKVVVKWLINHNILIQYALVSKLLYIDEWFVVFFFLFFCFYYGFHWYADAARSSRTRVDLSTKDHDFSFARVFHINKIIVVYMNQSLTDVISKYEFIYLFIYLSINFLFLINKLHLFVLYRINCSFKYIFWSYSKPRQKQMTNENN